MSNIVTKSQKNDIESPDWIQNAKVPKLELKGILDDVETIGTRKEQAGEVTPAFCLQPASELQLQRKVSHTPKNSPKKSLEQFNKDSLQIFDTEMSQD